MSDDDEAKRHAKVAASVNKGIIGSAEIARKLAELALEYMHDKAEVERQRPLTVEDHGETWRIDGSWNRDGSEFKGPFRMVVKKRDAQILDIGVPAIGKMPEEAERIAQAAMRLTGYLDRNGRRKRRSEPGVGKWGISEEDQAKWHVEVTAWFNGGVIGTAEIARKFAELVLESTQGKDALERQRPLSVENYGGTWVIRGRVDASDGEATARAFCMVVKKEDAQILDIGSAASVRIDPDAKPILGEQLSIRDALKQHFAPKGSA